MATEGKVAYFAFNRCTKINSEHAHIKFDIDNKNYIEPVFKTFRSFVGLSPTFLEITFPRVLKLKITDINSSWCLAKYSNNWTSIAVLCRAQPDIFNHFPAYVTLNQAVLRFNQHKLVWNR